MVPKISDDPDVRMCISGFLAEGSSNDVRVTKDLNSNSLVTQCTVFCSSTRFPERRTGASSAS